MCAFSRGWRKSDDTAPPPVFVRPAGPPVGVDNLLGCSPAIEQLKANIRILNKTAQAIAGTDFPAVLIHGETGTGKELVARALHANDPNRQGGMVEINCACIPAHLLEAELFGYQKGAFTDASSAKMGLVEAADGGTLFLDEIGEVDLSIQAKLLKLLEDKTIRRLGAVTESRVNVRIVSATNRDLVEMVRAGKFRSDLFFRLRVLTLEVPPLRDRGADVLLLARHFLAFHARRYASKALYFSADAERALLQYAWPGNVRELRNMIEQAVLLAQGEEITARNLSFHDQHDAPQRRAPRPDVALAPLVLPDAAGRPGKAAPSFLSPASYDHESAEHLADVTAGSLMSLLNRTGWNISQAAKQLGVPRAALRHRIVRFKLVRPLS